MRIGIDARFYGILGKGLGRYTQKLLENLEHLDNRNEYFVFLRSENFEEYVPSNPNFKKILADYGWYTFAEQWMFPKLLKKYDLDLVHFPHFNVPLFYRRPFVVTIHDLILLHFPTLRGTLLNPIFYWMKYLAYKLNIASAIRRAEKVIAVSNFTAQDIVRYYPAAKDKIRVIYEACDDYCILPQDADRNVLENLGLKDKECGIIKPYLTYVGNVYPHKNPERLLLAFREVKKEISADLKLLFVGGEDHFYRQLKNFVAEKNIPGIIFAGRLDDRELWQVQRGALTYVRPSLYEGFELPPLEAMACGVPVLCSDHSCAREILGDSALYFDPLQIGSIAAGIRKIVEDEQLRRSLVEKGYSQIKKYSWKKMAEETLDLYESK